MTDPVASSDRNADAEDEDEDATLTPSSDEIRAKAVWKAFGMGVIDRYDDVKASAVHDIP